jgi:hypothetical protein
VLQADSDEEGTWEVNDIDFDKEGVHLLYRFVVFS